MQRMEAIEVLAGFKGAGLSVATMRAIPDWYAQGAEIIAEFCDEALGMDTPVIRFTDGQ